MNTRHTAGEQARHKAGEQAHRCDAQPSNVGF